MVGILGICAIVTNLGACKRENKGEPASMLLLTARHIEDAGNLKKADALYQEALAQARDEKAKTTVIEILSRLVRVRIDDNRIKDTEPLVTQAVDIVTSLKGKANYDPEMNVWMDDMADAFYSTGQRASHENVREYCLRRYLDIKLPIADRFDVQLMAKANLLTNYLQHKGNYLDALEYAEKSFAYLEQGRPNDPETMAIAYYSLGNAYLAAQKSSKAELAFDRCLKLMNRRSRNIVWEGIAKGHLATAKLEAGKIADARELYRQAIDLHRQSIGVTAALTQWDYIALGLLEQQVGDLTKARELFRNAFEASHKEGTRRNISGNFLRSEGAVYSSKVIAAEHLAQIEKTRGEFSSSKSHLTMAKKIRAANPDWAINKNTNPEFFYLLTGFFPWMHNLPL